MDFIWILVVGSGKKNLSKSCSGGVSRVRMMAFLLSGRPESCWPYLFQGKIAAQGL